MRKKKWVLIIVFILVILLIGGVFAFLYFGTDLFKSADELFWKYFAQNEDVFAVLKNDKYNEQSQFKQTNSYTSNGKLSVLVEQGENSSKQLDIETTSRHDATTGRTYTDATLKNDDIDLFQVSYVNSNDIYAIKCEEVYENYVGIRNSGLTELATSYGIESTIDIPDSIIFENYSGQVDITDEQKQHILDTYLPIIQSATEGNASSPKVHSQIAINGTTYNANQYILQLTGENVKQIIVDCLNTMKSDTETLALISNKLSTLGFETEYTNISNLLLKIDELISQVQQMTMEDTITIVVYVSEGETVRTTIQIGDLVNITYNRAGGNPTITAEIYRTNTSAVDETENTNSIASAMTVTRVVFSKTTTDNVTTNSISISPDVDNSDTIINITYSLSSVQNNSINNSYSITINNVDDSGTEVNTISYNTNMVAANQVEEIEELTNSNTVIANNYGAEEFTSFITNWLDLVEQAFYEKLSVIGF